VGSESLQGIGVSGGVAVGRALLLDRVNAPAVALLVPEDAVESEVARLTEARARVRGELLELKERVHSALGDRYAGVIETHLLILDDPALVAECERRIRDMGLSASWALKEAVDGFIARFSAVDDAYFRERGGDLADVHRRLQQVLAGASATPLAPEGPVVVVAHSLGPADAVLLTRLGVVGLATDLGGPTSHTAILARALGVPTVLGLHDVSRRVSPGDTVVVDADGGRVEVRPGPLALADAAERRRGWQSRETRVAQSGLLPAITRDGRSVVLRANVELPEEVDLAIRLGAEGIGLYRSEFLLVGRATPPTVEEHASAYAALARRVAPHPAVIRTFDLGGEKPVGECLTGGGRRPALGLRGVRFCLRHPEVFRPQLRGLLRAAAEGDLRILLPLVTDREEIRAVRRLLSEEAAALAEEGRPHRASVPVGIMVEVPGAALTADALAQEAEFFSIGTNDLVQYALAVGRNDDDVAGYYQPQHPGVLRLMRLVVDAAAVRGIPVSLCGEMASDPAHVPVLLGLGLAELSVQPRALAPVRAAIRTAEYGAARDEVRAILGGHGIAGRKP
jgi:phosphotransferase system enzyme I (PtsI)